MESIITPNEADWMEMQSQFDESANRAGFSRASAAALGHVSAWRWANDSGFETTPFHREIFKAPALKWSKTDTGKVEHGLDAGGTIWVMRRWPRSDQSYCRQEFIERLPGIVDLYGYEGTWKNADLTEDPEKIELRWLHRSRFQDNRIELKMSIADGERTWMAFRYEGGLLVRSTFDAPGVGKAGPIQAHREYHYRYGGDGAIAQIDTEYSLLPDVKVIEKKTVFRRK